MSLDTCPSGGRGSTGTAAPCSDLCLDACYPRPVNGYGFLLGTQGAAEARGPVSLPRQSLGDGYSAVVAGVPAAPAVGPPSASVSRRGDGTTT